MKPQFEFLLAMTFLATFIHRSTSSSSHLVQVINNCNSPTSIQIPGQGNFTTPISKTFQGDINGGIAQACSNINGNGCTSVEFELTDGTSSADITLIPPHKFDVSKTTSKNELKNLFFFLTNLFLLFIAPSHFHP